MSKKLDLTNFKIGKLTVISPAPSRNGKTYWNCVCECGKETIVQTYSLSTGLTKSCGCSQHTGNKKINLLGKKFGKLTVIEETDRRMAHCIVWKCLCECGGISYVNTNDLRQGKIISCGCIKSKGEEKIADILSKEKILFNKNKTLLNCRFPETNRCAVFDFYIETPEEEAGYYLIEYDGIQHFHTKTGGWNNCENLKTIQNRDKYKNQWCKENNITLIRIPYTHLKDLTIKDLIPKESSYVI